ncbi:hypothetical protein [Roseateles noduli]|uniref:hypothetical protein n=1 Tax=Roseateles noduli TaxID=2052484 RepID=UPI003D662E18
MPSATHLLGPTHSSTSVEEFVIRSHSPHATPSHSQEELLQGVEDSAEDVLSLLRPGDPDSRATEAFEKAMVASARKHLETRIDEMALGLAEATGRSPDAIRTDVLIALCDLAQSPNVADTRQQLIDRTCVNANGLRLAIHQATASDLHTIEQAILSNGRQADEEASFELVVDQVRQTYGAHGPLDLLASADIEQQVRQLTNYLAPGLAEAFQKFGLSRLAHEADYITTLRKAAIILVDHGINTTMKVNRFLTRAQAHDDKVAFATGALGQVGYGAGMGAFMYAVAPKIAPALLGGIGGVGGAIAFGAVAGTIVGYLDCIAGSGASALKDALSYAGSGPLTSDVARKMRMSECKDIGTRVGISAAATFTKNALLRAVVPSVVYAVAFPAGISRDVRDGIDFAGDAGGGLISGGVANVLNRKTLDNRQSSNFKLLAQRNLPQLLQKDQTRPRARSACMPCWHTPGVLAQAPLRPPPSPSRVR